MKAITVTAMEQTYAPKHKGIPCVECGRDDEPSMVQIKMNVRMIQPQLAQRDIGGLYCPECIVKHIQECFSSLITTLS